MLIKQVSVFVENKAGRMAEIIDILGKSNIDISALSLADTTNFGILRMIVDKPIETQKILQDNDITVKLNDVIAVAISDEPGGLSKALNVLKDNDVQIDYMYAFVGKKEKEAMVMLKVNDIETALNILKNKGIKTLEAKDINQQ